MIASLRGSVQSKSNSALILDVSGVGYLVQIPSSQLSNYQIGESAFLFTTQIIREDSSQLFGFAEIEQQALFDQLRSVSGVGPKTALAIIATLSPAEISMAVTEDDSKPFERVSGVGVKTAKLINLTLAGKIRVSSNGINSMNSDLLSALQTLGWTERIASPIVEEVCAANPQGKLPELIRACLARLSK